jgi:hypothetical protein
MSQNATLCRNLEALAQIVDQVQQPHCHCDVVAGGIHADHGIARSEQQSVENGSGNAHRIVGGMVGLKACAQPAGQSDGGAKPRGHSNLGGDEYQVLHPHQLADRSRHLRHKAGGKRGQTRRRGFIREKPIA